MPSVNCFEDITLFPSPLPPPLPPPESLCYEGAVYISLDLGGGDVGPECFPTGVVQLAVVETECLQRHVGLEFITQLHQDIIGDSVPCK